MDVAINVPEFFQATLCSQEREDVCLSSSTTEHKSGKLATDHFQETQLPCISLVSEFRITGVFRILQLNSSPA
jgi:hypothetical protein